MNSLLTTRLSRLIYFGQAVIFVLFGLLTKLFFVDVDMGARFKNFNRQLLTSDILLLSAVLFAIIGLLFNLIKRHKHSTLKDKTILISGILIAPMTLLLAFSPLLMTVSPGEVGANISYIISFIVGLGFLIWLVLIPVTLLGQGFRIIVLSLKR